tara:strand:+ start:632 stop:1192 length:561 start_codon:yes stop_codon:yes gene_type:complete
MVFLRFNLFLLLFVFSIGAVAHERDFISEYGVSTEIILAEEMAKGDPRAYILKSKPILSDDIRNFKVSKNTLPVLDCFYVNEKGCFFYLKEFKNIEKQYLGNIQRGEDYIYLNAYYNVIDFAIQDEKHFNLLVDSIGGLTNLLRTEVYLIKSGQKELSLYGGKKSQNKEIRDLANITYVLNKEVNE